MTEGSWFRIWRRDLTSPPQYYVAVSPINLVPSEIVDESNDPDTGPGRTKTAIEDLRSRSNESNLILWILPSQTSCSIRTHLSAAQTTGAYQLEIRVADPNVGDAQPRTLAGSNSDLEQLHQRFPRIWHQCRGWTARLAILRWSASADLNPRIREILEDDLESPRMFGGSIRQQHGQFTSADYAPAQRWRCLATCPIRTKNA